jgi:hypothetical protein
MITMMDAFGRLMDHLDKRSLRKIGSDRQKEIRNEPPGAVPIFAEAEVPGTYSFTLRLWPAEINEPIRSAPRLIVSYGDDEDRAGPRDAQRQSPPLDAGFDETI